jgi:hypothetical protein
MLTYMASCGSATCDQFDSTKARWFKIQEIARKAGPGTDWAQIDLMRGATARVTIPATLAPGNYLIRHEIIALHLANSKGGAEFYPSCTQLRVGGTQSGKADDSELVSLPGAYSDNDPGIYDPSVGVFASLPTLIAKITYRYTILKHRTRFLDPQSRSLSKLRAVARVRLHRINRLSHGHLPPAISRLHLHHQHSLLVLLQFAI